MLGSDNFLGCNCWWMLYILRSAVVYISTIRDIYRIYFFKISVKRGNISILLSAIFVDGDDDDLSQLSWIEKASYIYSLLQVHLQSKLLMYDMKRKLRLYMTSLSNKILNEKEYDWEPESLPVVGSYYFVMHEGELWPEQVTQVKVVGGL